MAVQRCLHFGGHGHNCPCKICRNFVKNLGYIWKLQMYAHFPFLRSVLCSFALFDPRVFFFENNNIFVQYIFYFLFKVYHNNHLALIRLLYCRARAEPNQNEIHLGHVCIIPDSFLRRYFLLHILFQFGLTIAPIQNTGLINAKYNNALYSTIIIWYNKQINLQHKWIKYFYNNFK